MSLNERQKAFCEYYAACFNATEAAIAAGYSKKTAYSIGAENLKKPEIQKYLRSLIETSKNSRIASVDEILTFYTETMRDTSALRKDRLAAAKELFVARGGVASSDDVTEIAVTWEDASGSDNDSSD